MEPKWMGWNVTVDDFESNTEGKITCIMGSKHG